jgi:hypothetical protein
MRPDESAPPIGGTGDAGRQQRSQQAVIARYIADLTRAA